MSNDQNTAQQSQDFTQDADNDRTIQNTQHVVQSQDINLTQGIDLTQDIDQTQDIDLKQDIDLTQDIDQTEDVEHKECEESKKDERSNLVLLHSENDTTVGVIEIIEGDESEEEYKRDDGSIEEYNWDENICVEGSNLAKRVEEQEMTGDEEDEQETMGDEKDEMQKEQVVKIKRGGDRTEENDKKLFCQTINELEKENNITDSVDYDLYSRTFFTTKEIAFNIISLVVYTITITTQVIAGFVHFNNNPILGFLTIYIVIVSSVYGSNIGDTNGVFKYLVQSSCVKYWVLRIGSTVFALTPVLQHAVNINIIRRSMGTVMRSAKIDNCHSYYRMKISTRKLHEIIKFVGLIPQICLQIYLAVKYFLKSQNISGAHQIAIATTIIHIVWTGFYQNETLHHLLRGKYKKFIGSFMNVTGTVIPIVCRAACTGFILTDDYLTKWIVLFLYLIHCLQAFAYKYFWPDQDERNLLLAILQGISLTITPEKHGTAWAYITQNIIFQIEDSIMIVYWFYRFYWKVPAEHKIYVMVLTETIMMIDLIFRLIQIVWIRFRNCFKDNKEKQKRINL